MAAHSKVSPQQLFLRMLGGITLTAIGPIILVLVLIVHIKIGAHTLSDFGRDVLTSRIVAASMIVTGMPIWFFHQRRLALGIRDGEWLDADLKVICRLVSGRYVYLVGVVTVLLYLVGICLRGRLYFLVGFSVVIFPIGAFQDLCGQFVAREDRSAAIETILQPYCIK